MTVLAPVLRSEWAKIRSVRSLLVALSAAFVATVGVTVLVHATVGRSEADNADFEPVHSSYFGLNFGHIAAVCFGVMAVAGEYTGGGIRLSLAAVPRRGAFWAGKLLVLGAVALPVGLATGFGCFLGAQALLGEYGVGLGTPGALQSAVGCGVYLALLTVFSAGVAAVVRSQVGALSVLTPVVFLISPVFAGVSGIGDVVAFLPDRAGQQILHPVPEGPLGAWSGMGVMALWTALAAAAGWWSLSRRDA
ncbi:ABC transporter permease [Streptomyces griseocarneus]|uniref:ABC transporter permease n=1 Tax=Streptomyces griseocarneus TaxID=51201 RepID=UPI00167D2CC2|nr:ABC transporter permease [Streptomyces griseocarneus]MBZ6477463.1 ABC transporter permease [Streptomyces griseocarneus]GHG49478.1 ABC transporter [Streptomyces griseocarneus]